MRASYVLALCMLAASASTFAADLPVATAAPRLQRRRVGSSSRMDKRLLDFGGGDGSNNAGNTSSSSSTTTSISSTTSSSTRTTSSSTTPTSTSTSTTPTSTVSSTTNSQGSLVLVTSTISAPAQTSTAAAASTSAASEDSGSGGHTGLIVGVSVVGGIAILGALIFLWMKFGGRRFSDYEHDDADIKWPELKADDNAAAMQPLPARRTGGAGFDMGDESDNGHDGGMGADSHSMHDYGAKAHDSMVASSTALHSSAGGMGGGGGGYGSSGYGHQGGGGGGGMETVYDDEPNYAAAQPGVTGYYDPYGSYATGGAGGVHASAQHDQQVFYPEQVGEYNQYAANGGGYAPGHDPYNVNTSPPSGPYRVGGHGGY